MSEWKLQELAASVKDDVIDLLVETHKLNLGGWDEIQKATIDDAIIAYQQMKEEGFPKNLSAEWIKSVEEKIELYQTMLIEQTLLAQSDPEPNTIQRDEVQDQRPRS